MWPVILLATLALLASLTASVGLAYISSKNYPGAAALNRLHERADKETKTTMKVHLDVAACQTGISRFLEAHPRVQYFKTENETDFDTKYTHRITEKEAAFGPPETMQNKARTKTLLDGQRWQAIDTIYGFKGIAFTKHYPFVQINMGPSLYIYQRVDSRDV